MLCLCSEETEEREGDSRGRGRDGRRKEGEDRPEFATYIDKLAVHINLGNSNGHQSLGYHLSPSLSLGPALLVRLKKAYGPFWCIIYKADLSL